MSINNRFIHLLLGLFVCSRLLADSAETHLQAAERALNDGLPEITILRLRSANLDLLSDPNRASLILAEAYLDLGEPTKAIDQLKKNPKNSDAKPYLLAKAYYQLGQWQQGLNQLEKIKNSPAELLRARFLVELNQSGEAIIALEKHLQHSDPNLQFEAKLLLAQLYLKDDRTVAAETLLEDIHLFPVRLLANAQLIKAQLFLKKGEEKKAQAVLDSLKEDELEPTDNNIANLLKAKCLLAQKLPEEAFSQLLRTLPELQDHSLLRQGLQSLRIVREASSSSKKFISNIQTVIAEDRNQASAIYTAYLKLVLAETLLKDGKQSELQEANELLTSILQKQNHPLMSEAYQILGKVQMKQGRSASAVESFLSADKNDQNIFQAAYASWMSGNWPRARQLFEQISQSSNKELVQAAKSNLATLIAAEGEATSENKDETIQHSLLLEKAFRAVRENSQDAHKLLEDFLNKAPEHPRADEAKLALAQMLIEQSPENAEKALKLLATIPPESKVDAYRLTNLKLRSYERLQQWDKLIQKAQDYIDKHADSPKALLVSLKLAEAFFENGNYNKARLRFAEIEKATKEDSKNTSIHEIALFYEAVSALRVATPSAKEDAIKLFKKVIRLDSSLSIAARKNLAEIYLDLGNYEQAMSSTKTILEKSFPGSNEWMEAIILASNINVAENKLDESLSFIEQGLERAGNKLFWKQQLLYLKALSYEKQRNDKNALETYLLVIDSPPLTQNQQQHWYWFEQAGFRAIELLEKNKRWDAAVAAANRIAAAKGPRAEKASEYAQKTSLKHMLWDEAPSPASE